MRDTYLEVKYLAVEVLSYPHTRVAENGNQNGTTADTTPGYYSSRKRAELQLDLTGWRIVLSIAPRAHL